MTNYDLKQILLTELGYSESPGLKSIETATRGIPNIESVYSVQQTPVAYVSRLSDADPSALRQLQQSIWNESKVPLLYVVLPQEIRIYNCYALPAQTDDELDQKDRLLQHLVHLTDIEQARQEIQRRLRDYERINLDTGAFWLTSDGQRITSETRADQHLLDAMDQLRRHLHHQGLANENAQVAYALIGRSIFIRYLEDRRLVTGELLSQLTQGRVTSYRAALSNLDDTYRLFAGLSERFNGDLFPVDEAERAVVRQEHLDIVQRFLDGTDLDSGQQRFWPYDFKYIPIELISGIYDKFLNTDVRRETGTYYTPLPLVDFVLNETLSMAQVNSDLRILDPACGSGVFLVRAFQRLVNNWIASYKGRPTGQQLSDLLHGSIFGVDTQPEAIRIAAFSLYLAILDFLGPDEIADPSFRFPSLKDSNLLVSDFFSPTVQEKFANLKFDRVIGNPPWGKGSLSDTAQQWLASRGYIIGAKQSAPAFLLYAPEFCRESGEVAMLAPAKSTILVSSGPHQSFRSTFLEQFDVRSVINFSALVYELFAESLSPVVAMFYKPKAPISPDQRIAYGVPKSSPLSHQLGAIVLDATEVKYLSKKDLTSNPVLWKVALWGSPRDAVLIKHLRSLPTLEEQARKLNWQIGQGFQVGGSDKNKAPWLSKLKAIPTRLVRRYVADTQLGEPIRDTVFHRTSDPTLFRAPLALIHQSPADKKCTAAFCAEDIAYRHKITGIAGRRGQESLLKWLVTVINSPLAQYYHFLTSTTWGVERGTIIQDEYKKMPFVIPDENDRRLDEVVYHFDQIADSLESGRPLSTRASAIIEEHENALAELVFDIYNLTSVERQLVTDMVDYGIEFYYWSKLKHRSSKSSRAVLPASHSMLRAYAEAFVDTATKLLRYQGQTLNALVYQDHAPLAIVGFNLVVASQAKSVEISQQPDELRQTLERLDHLLIEQQAATVYTRRHVRIYDGPWLYLVRPNEQRFWTASQARVDADAVLVEGLSQSADATLVP